MVGDRGPQPGQVGDAFVGGRDLGDPAVPPLGGEDQDIAGEANQLGGSRTSDNLVLTGGKFSVTDIFDTNSYSHDARSDFLNWAIVDAGAFDYAADAWGYSYGVAAEWNVDAWTLRGGVFDQTTA